MRAGAATRQPSAAFQAPADTLHLGVLQRAAERVDPRFAQLDLHDRIAELRLGSIGAERLPQLGFRADATYQSDVPEAVGADLIPGLGLTIPMPPKDRYEVAAEAEQLLFDGGRLGRREDVERARLAERRAETRAALYGLRDEFNRAFFAGLLEQERRAQLELLAADLAARRELVAAQVRGGVAVPSQLGAVEAEIIEVEQDVAEAEAARRTALARLEILLEREIDPTDVLAIPDLEHEAGQARAEFGRDSLAALAARPEWQRLARTRERLGAEAALEEAATRPRVTGFVQAAYGRPGLDFFDDAFSPYAVLGLRLRWPAVDWGATGHEAAARRLEADVVEAERAAFVEGQRRQVLAALFDAERLEAVLPGDERAVALREEVERTAHRQFEEGVLLPADYVDKRTDLFEARLRRRIHVIELAEARVRLLTVLGRDIEAPER